jgi:8-oxo-dGTP pyrophosphatase MutT (NUDIX family)
MDDLHEVQLHILKELIFRPNARFTDLNTLDLTSDHFTYHLTRLVEVGLVVKSKDRYSLTNAGKELAGRMDTDEISIQKQAKIGVIVCGVRQDNGNEECLVHTRLKEPFYGYQGFVTGKVKYGESVLEAAQREFAEEAHLAGNPELFAVYHYRHFSSDKDILKDQIFFATKVFNPIGKLLPRHSEGKNRWVPYRSLKSLNKPFPGVFQVIEDLHLNHFGFREREFVIEEF